MCGRCATLSFEGDLALVALPSFPCRRRQVTHKERHMFTKVGTIGVGVSNQDKALDFYVNTLGFEKIDDQPMSETERWLEVAPLGAQTHIMLGLRGQSGGDKTGFTGYVPHTDNIEATCPTLKARAAPLTKQPTPPPSPKCPHFPPPPVPQLAH